MYDMCVREITDLEPIHIATHVASWARGECSHRTVLDFVQSSTVCIEGAQATLSRTPTPPPPPLKPKNNVFIFFLHFVLLCLLAWWFVSGFAAMDG